MKVNYILFVILTFMLSCNDSDKPERTDVKISCNPTELTFAHAGETKTVSVSSTREWLMYSEDKWIQFTPSSSLESEATVTVTAEPNKDITERTGTLVVKSGTERISISLKQGGVPMADLKPNTELAENYKLVWHDEFDDASAKMLNEKAWWYENWESGRVNNELQRYVQSEKTAAIENGILKIRAIKEGDEVQSARVNTSESWKYGYFEAKLKLPKGKGTWPAFWMMPKEEGPWPDCGEIDIMEEIGGKPNYVSSSIHCKSYNHVQNTQKTRETLIDGAEDEFHIYALEWTPDYIRTYVDGKELFYYPNDGKNNADTWPFNKPFYLKLNLAWGGTWGGSHGVDETALPATYEIDYVRVFQIKQ